MGTLDLGSSPLTYGPKLSPGSLVAVTAMTTSPDARPLGFLIRMSSRPATGMTVPGTVACNWLGPLAWVGNAVHGVMVIQLSVDQRHSNTAPGRMPVPVVINVKDVPADIESGLRLEITGMSMTLT